MCVPCESPRLCRLAVLFIKPDPLSLSVSHTGVCLSDEAGHLINSVISGGNLITTGVCLSDSVRLVQEARGGGAAAHVDAGSRARARDERAGRA